MAAPVGALVRIGPFAWTGPDAPPGQGDVLVSTGGSIYDILSARRTPSGRLYFRCIKLDEVPPGARVVSMFWLPRRRKR